MKINKLEKLEDGTIVDINISMTDAENAFFVAFAFNHLMKQGLLRINEETQDVEVIQPAVVGD